ncbi:MAG: peptidylprolyl isomerase [Phycisphaerales bacterium JB043]
MRTPIPCRLLVALTVGLLVSVASSGQLVPEREFYGINRSIPMSVTLPDGVASTSVEIALYAPESTEPVERASAEVGGVDLSTLFPILWTRSLPTLLYAQLIADDQPVGSPVVLQPMLTPRRASAQGRDIRWPGAGQSIYSGIRAFQEVFLVFETSHGQIEFALRPDHAPNTSASITSLVEGGFYTDILIHRIEPSFVIQFGDPTGQGSGGPGYQSDLEPSQLSHDFGVLSMARSGNPDSNGSQLFICLTRQRTAPLDGKYVAFAEAVSGAEVIQSLGGVDVRKDPKSGMNKPVDQLFVVSAHTVPAPPYPNRPSPLSTPDPSPTQR